MQQIELGQAKDRSQDFHGGLHMSGRDPSTRAIILCFPRQKTGSWILRRGARTRTGTLMGAGVPSGGLACYTTISAPLPFLSSLCPLNLICCCSLSYFLKRFVYYLKELQREGEGRKEGGKKIERE